MPSPSSASKVLGTKCKENRWCFKNIQTWKYARVIFLSDLKKLSDKQT